MPRRSGSPRPPRHPRSEHDRVKTRRIRKRRSRRFRIRPLTDVTPNPEDSSMSHHFSSFTAEAMSALGRELADGAQARAAFRARLREQVTAMMEQVRREAEQAVQERRERVARDADARRVFVAELR